MKAFLTTVLDVDEYCQHSFQDSDQAGNVDIQQHHSQYVKHGQGLIRRGLNSAPDDTSAGTVGAYQPQAERLCRPP